MSLSRCQLSMRHPLTIYFCLSLAYEAVRCLKTNCTTVPVFEGQATNVTCHFSNDISQTRAEIIVHKYDKDEILNCYWAKSKRECDVDEKYTFNGTATTDLTINIPNMTKKYKGVYACQIVPSEHSDFSMCEVTFQVKTTPQANPPNITDTAKTETTKMTDIMIIGLCMGGFVFLVTIIITIICIRRRKRRRLGELSTQIYDVESVRLLPTDKEKQTLFTACQTGEVDTVERSLRENRDFNITNDDGDTPLHVAVKHGHFEVVKLLIDSKCTVDAKNKQDQTPIHLACKHAKDLDDKQPTSTVHDHDVAHSQTVIQTSHVQNDGEQNEGISTGIEEDTEALQPTSGNAGQQTEQCTPWHADGSCKILKLLLGASSRGECQSVSIEVRVQQEISQEDGEDVSLIPKQSDSGLEARDSQGRTPLHWACHSGHEPSIRTLLEAGADVDVKDKSDCTPLHLACQRGEEEAVRALLKHWPKPDVAKDEQGQTALHTACKGKNEAIIEMLLSMGASTEARDKIQQTPLHSACDFGRETAVETLMRHKADVRVADRSKRTPLHLACGNKTSSETLIRLLLDAGADIEAKDQLDYRPLHMACRSGNIQAVKILISRKANKNEKTKQEKMKKNNNRKKKTPSYIARENGFSEIVTLLKK